MKGKRKEGGDKQWRTERGKEVRVEEGSSRKEGECAESINTANDSTV